MRFSCFRVLVYFELIAILIICYLLKLLTYFNWLKKKAIFSETFNTNY